MFKVKAFSLRFLILFSDTEMIFSNLRKTVPLYLWDWHNYIRQRLTLVSYSNSFNRDTDLKCPNFSIQETAINHRLGQLLFLFTIYI